MYDLKVPTMYTTRLLIRETKESDYSEMFEYAKLDNVGPMAGWAPHKRLSDTRQILKSFSDKKLYGQLGTGAIIYKENNKMIGTIELHSYVTEFKAELGYTISPEYWGKGLAVEASIEFLRWGFEILNLKRIECTSFVNNYQSQRVCEKLKFEYEGIRKKGYQLYDGTIHDLKCYAITDDLYFSKEYQDYLMILKNERNN